MLAPHDVLAFHDLVGRSARRTRATTASTTARMSGAVPSTRASDVTPRSGMPHGTMWSNIAEIGVDVEREAVTGAAARDLHADRGDLLVTDPHAGIPRLTVRGDTELGERVDEHAFERAHVRDDVAQAVAPVGQRDDRVADELTGPVIRDVAAAIRAHELGADARRRHQHVRRGRRVVPSV